MNYERLGKLGHGNFSERLIMGDRKVFPGTEKFPSTMKVHEYSLVAILLSLAHDNCVIAILGKQLLRGSRKFFPWTENFPALLWVLIDNSLCLLTL